MLASLTCYWRHINSAEMFDEEPQPPSAFGNAGSRPFALPTLPPVGSNQDGRSMLCLCFRLHMHAHVHAQLDVLLQHPPLSQRTQSAASTRYCSSLDAGRVQGFLSPSTTCHACMAPLSCLHCSSTWGILNHQQTVPRGCSCTHSIL